jgi:hypothetical protein
LLRRGRCEAAGVVKISPPYSWSLFAWPENSDYRPEHAVERCSSENAYLVNQQFLKV